VIFVNKGAIEYFYLDSKNVKLIHILNNKVEEAIKILVKDFQNIINKDKEIKFL